MADQQMAAAIRQSLRALVEPYFHGTSYHLPTVTWLLTATAE